MSVRSLVLFLLWILLFLSVLYWFYRNDVRLERISSAATPYSDILLLLNNDRSSGSEISLPLKEDNDLDSAANNRESFLCVHQFSHNGWEESFKDLPYTHMGENIARNYPDASSTNTAFMDSEEHRDNILDTKFEDIGIASGNCPKESDDGTQSVTVELFGGYN